VNFLVAIALFAVVAPVFGAPRYVATFHSIGLYWSPPGGNATNGARVEFREPGTPTWRQGLALWFDTRNSEYRGSLVELKPDTAYEVRLMLDSGLAETLKAVTWSETFRVKRTVQVAPGSTHLVIDATDSGNESEGYVVFTAAPGRNVIDQKDVPGNAAADSCVVVKQGTHHVIIRGLVLRNCKRHGVFLERQWAPVLDSKSHDIVIENNEISGWGASGGQKPGMADDDGAVQCGYYHETISAKKPDRVVVQRNRIHSPRHSANPWQAPDGPRLHPRGPQGVNFTRCGGNHVFRYNDIYSSNGNYYNDGIGGSDNFSFEGFPGTDSDIYGNRISHVYDDAIEAEGANRNVRIWGNYLDQTLTAIANAATSLGPLYVWRNVSHWMAGMYSPGANPDSVPRGAFIKGGSRNASFNGGRAYYFHNTILQPPPAPDARYSMGAGSGIENSGGGLFNFVSRNNIWHIHKEPQVDGESKYQSIRADGHLGFIESDFDLYNGPVHNSGRKAERRGWGPGAKGRPVYVTSGSAYPDLATQPGNFALKKGSPGYRRAAPIPNFNDLYPQPADVGAHQSGTPPMQFGVDAYRGRL
jgi:hypothetical protein